MLLTEFIDLLDKIENESSTNKKIEIIKPHITDPFFLSLLTMPAINIGDKTILKVLAKHTGHDINDITTEYILNRRVSDVVEITLNSKRTTSLSDFFKIKGVEKDSERKEKVTILQVYSILTELATVTGFSKQSSLLHTLFNMSNSSQVINIISGDRALGIKENNIFKALPGKTSDIAKAYAMCNNWFLLCSSIENLSEIKPMLFTPITSQLCETQSLEGFTVKKPVAVDTKYDGVRLQVHCRDNRIEIYTRRLENKTQSMPDFIESISEWVALNKNFSGIFDMELLPHVTKEGKFVRLDQEAVMTRLGKHNIHYKMKEVQLDARIFDVMVLNDEILIEKSFKERRKVMEGFEYTNDIKLSHVEVVKTTEEFRKVFFEITKQEEGVVIKPSRSKYIPGNRGVWEKIKPLLPTFDLVITKAFYGKNKNAGFYSSFEVSAMRSNGELRGVGKVGIGFSEKDMEELTDKINAQLINRVPTLEYVEIEKPDILIEVACEKVNLIRGHISMDFARKVSIRTDKNDVTTFEEMKKFVRSAE